jgi:tetratricopeptide (TPR) repeat protein
MDAVSYPHPKVIAFFEKHLAPVRVLNTSQPLPQQFKVQWTPTLVLLDAKGEEHHRTVGFLPPEELIPSLMLGIAKSYFDRGQYSLAANFLEQLLAEYPKSAAAPEATYYLGVTRYKDTNNPGALKQAAEALQANYPESEWAKRASVYQLI